MRGAWDGEGLELVTDQVGDNSRSWMLLPEIPEHEQGIQFCDFSNFCFATEINGLSMLNGWSSLGKHWEFPRVRI